MGLKGDYSSETTYSIGDIVRYTDDGIYRLFKAAPAGTTPINTLYWNPVDQRMADCARMVLDIDRANDTTGTQHKLANNLTTTAAGKGLDARQGKALKELIDALTERVAALEPEEEPTPDADNNGGEGT
jgi:hypothetical protein